MRTIRGVSMLFALLALLAVAVVGCTGKLGQQGPAGLKGDSGAQGIQGLPGAKGDSGPAGPRGETGATGPKGDAGIQGLPGVVRFYTVTTAELPIPNTPAGEGNLQPDVLCRAGDLAVGGGHIVHPSSTVGVFVTKSYPTDAAGAFAPASPDRWRVKVLNPNNLAGTRVTAHVFCLGLKP